MRKPLQETLAAGVPVGGGALDEQEELALLAEFTRHDSVAALAGAIAARLGRNAKTSDLIARADLDPSPAETGVFPRSSMAATAR